MSSAGVRTQRSVVDTIAQRGYDHLYRMEKRRQQINQMPTRQCSHEECTTILSRYNDTDWCSLHQTGNVVLNKFL
jgi:hypothetical protein